jgi:hypothetical protein
MVARKAAMLCRETIVVARPIGNKPIPNDRSAANRSPNTIAEETTQVHGARSAKGATSAVG